MRLQNKNLRKNPCVIGLRRTRCYSQSWWPGIILGNLQNKYPLEFWENCIFWEMTNISIDYGEVGKGLSGALQRIFAWKAINDSRRDCASGKHWKQFEEARDWVVVFCVVTIETTTWFLRQSSFFLQTFSSFFVKHAFACYLQQYQCEIFGKYMQNGHGNPLK